MSNFDDRYNDWERFIVNNVLPEDLPIQIAHSWERCRQQLSPIKSLLATRLSSEHLLNAQVAKFDFISIARPILEDIFQFIEGSSSAVILVNSAGYVLDMIADSDLVKFFDDLGIRNGASLSESQAGTNAFALALIERFPLQISGTEHYLMALHPFTDAAAPVFDISGSPLGALGVLTRASNGHPHSLGLAVAGARAIEGQRQSEYLLVEQNNQLTSLNAILATINEGILMWNREGVIVHANDAAVQVLECPKERLMGHPIRDRVSFPQPVLEAIASREILSDIEIILKIDQRSFSCILSIRYAQSSSGLQAVVAILRPVQQVRKLVQSQLGAQTRLTLDSLVGETSAIRRVRRLAKSAAAARASILITGESGTGKSTLARAIHHHGPRRDSPFIVFSASSLPDELVTYELLGYEDSAGLGLQNSRPSKFELADGGTIYFPDVETLPFEAQTALLNTLELGIVQRLGSKRAIEVDVRAIATTSSDIRYLIQRRNFSADLYYRLHPFEIHLPPLRERKEDIPLLIEDILGRINRQNQTRYSLSHDAISMLSAYDWPGNVRELEVCLQRAIIQTGASKIIHAEYLPEHIRYAGYIQLENPPLDTLEDMERMAILEAARSCNGNVTLMAKVLGIGRTTVWRRLRQFEISPDDFRD